jgi:hypothetical protein
MRTSSSERALVDFLAKACAYARQHIDDADAWPDDPDFREKSLQCVSFQVACFLAQNTSEGDEGVDCDVVLALLIEHPAKPEKTWRTIINGLAFDLGGWMVA